MNGIDYRNNPNGNDDGFGVNQEWLVSPIEVEYPSVGGEFTPNNSTAFSFYLDTAQSLEGNGELMAELSAVRLEREFLNYLMTWNNPPSNITEDWNPNNPETFWHMSSPVAYAIERAAGGFQGGQAPFVSNRANTGQFQEDTMKVDASLLFFRDVFGSTETYTLATPNDYENLLLNNREGD
jgi:hypothetical protein